MFLLSPHVPRRDSWDDENRRGATQSTRSPEENFSANNVSMLKINDQDQPVDLSKSTNLMGGKNKAIVL